MAGLQRYRHIGRVYDILSLERILYSKPRRHLHELIGPLPATTILDVGCGTGLNFAGLCDLVGPGGHVIGIDASPSMLAAARRRIRQAGWTNVTVICADAAHLGPALETAGVDLDDIDALIATFVISTLTDPASFWNSVDQLRARHPRLIALADLGTVTSGGRVWRFLARTLAALGGSQPTHQPWQDLSDRCSDAVTETDLGGHVRLALGHCR